MAVTSEGIFLSPPGKAIYCQYKLCGSPATGAVMVPRLIFLCEEHSRVMRGQFCKFAKGQSFAELIHCTEIKIDRPAAAGEESQAHGKSETSP